MGKPQSITTLKSGKSLHKSGDLTKYSDHVKTAEWLPCILLTLTWPRCDVAGNAILSTISYHHYK